MLDEWKKKITDGSKTVFTGNWGHKSRYLITAAVCLGLLSLIWPQNQSIPTQTQTTTSSASLPAEGVDEAKANLAREMEGILSQVDGAGTVRVSITLRSDGLKSYARNTKNEQRETQELDSNGGDRNIKEDNQSSDIAVSGGSALLLEDCAPEIVGVLIVAEGARNSLVKEQLTDAAVTLLNVSPCQVRVVARKGDMQ